MKRIAVLLLFVAGLSAVGCLSGPQPKDDKTTAKFAPAPPPPTVMADGINEKNAAEKAKALRAELEADLARQGR